MNTQTSPLSIPAGALVEVTPFPGCDRKFRGICQGREFGDPNAAGKHFVRLTTVIPDEGAPFPINSRGAFWGVRALTEAEVAAVNAEHDRLIALVD
jgi:hypothetical protein